MACLLPVLASAPLACSVEDARVEFSFSSEVTGADSAGLTIRFSDGGRSRTVHGRDFRAARGDASARSRAFDTASDGTLRVDVRLQAPSGDSLSTVHLELPLREDWIHTVRVHVGDENPSIRCRDCAGAIGAQVHPSAARTPGDSLFVIWSGNFLSEPGIS